MGEFLSQFGISWKLLLSQLINFALILIVLRIFIYKPLLNVLKERREKIEKGLMKAEECDVRLKEVDEMAKGKQKEEELLKMAEIMADSRKKEMYEGLKMEAGQIIRSVIAKAIKDEPEQIDEKLIKKTVDALVKDFRD